MKKVNLNEMKEEAWKSPGGKFTASFKGISDALGREPASFDLSKRHPFDLEWTRVPRGKSNFPYHAHSAQWELKLPLGTRTHSRYRKSTRLNSNHHNTSYTCFCLKKKIEKAISL